jgi:hypothetical protein
MVGLVTAIRILSQMSATFNLQRPIRQRKLFTLAK